MQHHATCPPDVAGTFGPHRDHVRRILRNESRPALWCALSGYRRSLAGGRAHAGRLPQGLHVRYDAWISANGKTLVERDVWNATFQPDGSKSVRGLTVHIAGPGGGIAQYDAGQLVYDQHGNLVRVDGPHPQLSGESFCPALVV
jgi:hypothetical protein